MEQYRRRFGDRKDGRRLRSLDPLNSVSPYIMKNRVGAQNMIRDTIDLTLTEKYVRKKREEGLSNFGIMHVFIAAYVRVISQRPGVNRFISGQRIFARNNIELCLTIKKEMTLNAMETIVKVEFDPASTAEDVYHRLNAAILENREDGDKSDFDKTARFLKYIPGLLLKFSIFALNLLDYFGLLPKFLLKVSPFHASLFLTSMGSLGIPPIYHHLYDFGNIPVFFAYGAKRTQLILKKDGPILEKKFLDFTVVTDERICDGHYFASALKLFREYFKNPDVLDSPPEKIIQDID